MFMHGIRSFPGFWSVWISSTASLLVPWYDPPFPGGPQRPSVLSVHTVFARGPAVRHFAMRTKRARRVVLSSSPSPSSSSSDPKAMVRAVHARTRRRSAARFVAGAATRPSDGETTPSSSMSDFVASSSASDGASGGRDVRRKRGVASTSHVEPSRRRSRPRAQVLVDSEDDEADGGRRKRVARRASKREVASTAEAVQRHRDEVLRPRASTQAEEVATSTSASTSDLDDFIAHDADPDAPEGRARFGPAPKHPWSENGTYWTYVRYLLLCECEEGFHEHLLRLVRRASDTAEARGARHLLACARRVEASLCDRKRFLVDSTAWTPSFATCVHTRPRLCVEPCDIKHGDCEACGRANHPSTYVMRFEGRAYDADALWRFDAPVASKRGDVDDARRFQAREAVEFAVGRFCCARAQVYHVLHHGKRHLLQSLRDRLDRGSTRQSAVDAFLQDEGRIRALYQATQRLLAMAERYCTSNGGSWSAMDGQAVSDQLQDVLYAFHSDYGVTTDEEGGSPDGPAPSESCGEPLYPPGCAPSAIARRGHVVVLSSDTSQGTT